MRWAQGYKVSTQPWPQLEVGHNHKQDSSGAWAVMGRGQSSSSCCIRLGSSSARQPAGIVRPISQVRKLRSISQMKKRSPELG